MAGSTPRRVGMVLETAFPPDARVEREALALVEAGYEVFLLCGKPDSTHPNPEDYHGIHVERATPSQLPKSSLGFWQRGLGKNLRRQWTGVEGDWQALIDRFIRQHNIDILHVHDLKLLPTSLAAAASHPSLKLVADLHENYPALVGRLTEIRKGPQKGRQKQHWWEQIERKTLPQADHIVVVAEEARERILHYAGVTSEAITVLQNVVDHEKFLAASQTPLPEKHRHKLEGRFVLCYVGHINSSHRGIHTVLAALPRLIERIPNLLFVGAGAVQPDYDDTMLQPLIAAHHLEDYVDFTGYCDEIDFVPFIRQADVCLCPHVQTALTDTTFPNKVFLYHLFQKPVVVSSCRPLVHYVTDTESGLVYSSEDANALAEAILSLHQDPELRGRLGTNGYRAVMSRFCWQQEKQRLLELYGRL